MVFETKKIQLETLGEYLREVRSHLNFSIEEVSKKNSIKLQFLESLEDGKFQALPADVYVVGFLKQLAEFYVIDANPLVEQYKKERAIERQVTKKSRFDRAVTGYPLGRLVITPKSVSIFVGFLFVVATLGYIVWQILSINKTPSLTVFEPQDQQMVKSSAVTVQGKTDPGMSLTINDQDVFVSAQGDFKTEIGMNNGPKQLVFLVKNKFDKSASKTITVIGAAPDLTVVEGGSVQLKLDFSDAVTLSYSIDDQASQSLSFQSGDTKILTARNKITISTSNAGATHVLYNNTNIGSLGRNGEQLKNVPFFKQTPVDATASSTQQ